MRVSATRLTLSLLAFALLATGVPPVVLAQSAVAPAPIGEAYRGPADRLIAAAVGDSAAYTKLATLVDRFGHRLSGSASLESAIDWILDEMRREQLDNVHGEPVRVPHWIRGRESAELVRPRPMALHMLGLGGSVATPAAGIAAPVLVVSSFEDLTAHAAEARGRIVVFDVPFTTYDQTVRYRVGGASAAARVGAVASLVRSVTPQSLRSPHTGQMVYDSTGPRIPHAAVSVEDAMLLHRMQDRGEHPVVRLRMESHMLPDAPSRNVVAEITGSERPDEVVVLGGHIDSWDVGQGAMDDGGGAVAAWEAVRLMKVLGLRPRRTVRVVLWTNEENGGRGGIAYRDAHRASLDRHVLAIESDEGAFTPHGFAFTGSDAAHEIVRQVAALLAPIGGDSITRGGGEADIEPLMEAGVPGMALAVDGSRYFWYHHTDADTIDKLDPHQVALCVATLAVMAYVVADLPAPLPRAPTAAR